MLMTDVWYLFPMLCIHMHVTSVTDHKTLLVTWVVWNLANTVSASF